MSKAFFSLLFLLCMLKPFAQKNSFGVVNYTVPADYQLIKNDNVLTYYKENNTTGAYCNFFIYKLMPGQGGTQRDFEYSWANLVQTPFKFISSPAMQPEAVLKGWKFLLGNTRYNDNGVATLAMLINFSGENDMQAICILSNSDSYKTDIENFISSIDISREIAGSESTQNPNASPDGTTSDNSIAGLWTVRDDQTLGIFNGNTKSTTIGYFRHGYLFNMDGTYAYYNKIFLTRSKTISFAYETGTWSVNGDQLTITPAKGQNEEWSKSASGKSDEWGSRLKITTRKLETVTYTFGKKTSPVDHLTRLLLQYDKQTERDGKYNDTVLRQWAYSPLDKDPEDLPPGMKFIYMKSAK